MRLTVEQTQTLVKVIVENGGEAIAPSRIPALFAPFERGTTAGHGVGLGLYIVREIARAHRGGRAMRFCARRDDSG